MYCVKLTLALLPLFFIFCSCVHNPYMTVAGINIPKNEKNELISDNCTPKVYYLLLLHSGQLGISVYDNLQEPLEIV